MIDSHTKLFGIIGNPVAHSKSPLMHNGLFEHYGLNNRYLAFDVDSSQLRETVIGIRAFKIKGMNVTIPHKVKIMEYLDDISQEAREIGAVNTIVNDNGKLIGYNTDGDGYVRSLIEETNIKLPGKRVLIIGAGGAARAISYALAKNNIQAFIIANRNMKNAMEMVERLGKDSIVTAIHLDDMKAYLKDADVIINTTSIGMSPDIDQSPIDAEFIQSKHVVSDIIYNPLKTKLLKDAASKGAAIHSGLGMFIYQGAIAFEKWTGIAPNVKLMKEIVLHSLENK